MLSKSDEEIQFKYWSFSMRVNLALATKELPDSTLKSAVQLQTDWGRNKLRKILKIPQKTKVYFQKHSVEAVVLVPTS